MSNDPRAPHEEIRLCALCRHFDSKYESPGGGCSTCGYGAGKGFTLTCKLKHFSDESLYDTSDFYAVLRRARECDDFTPMTAAEIAEL